MTDGLPVTHTLPLQPTRADVGVEMLTVLSVVVAIAVIGIRLYLYFRSGD